MISLFGIQNWNLYSYEWKGSSKNRGELSIRGSILIEKKRQSIFGLNFYSPSSTQRVIISAPLPDAFLTLDLKELIKKGYLKLEFNF